MAAMKASVSSMNSALVAAEDRATCTSVRVRLRSSPSRSPEVAKESEISAMDSLRLLSEDWIRPRSSLAWSSEPERTPMADWVVTRVRKI